MCTEPRGPLEAGFSVTALKRVGKPGSDALLLPYCARNGATSSSSMMPSNQCPASGTSDNLQQDGPISRGQAEPIRGATTCTLYMCRPYWTAFGDPECSLTSRKSRRLWTGGTLSSEPPVRANKGRPA